MRGLTNWVEKHFVPLAAKIGSQRHMMAVRDAFIMIMPVTLAGAISSLLNVFLKDIPQELGWNAFVESVVPLIEINEKVFWGTTTVITLAFVFALGYHLARSYDVNPLGGALTAFAAYLTTVPNSIADIGSSGYYYMSYTQATGLFTGIVIALIAVTIFAKLSLANITIRFPDTVPPAVSRSLVSVLPATIAIFAVAIIAQFAVTISGYPINDLIVKYVQAPFLNLSQGLGAVILLTLAVQVFWFFGLHGTNTLGAILDGVWLSALLENSAAHSAGEALPYIWTRGSFDAYAWMGGAGCTLGLIIAILIFSKKSEEKAIAKMGAPMGMFNINEPITFGLPLVLNPLYMIPYVIIPPLLASIAYGFTYFGLIPPVFIQIPWIVPPILYAFLATGGSLRAALVAVLNLFVAVGIWGFFVRLANRLKNKE